jgi:hypothetical protein
VREMTHVIAYTFVSAIIFKNASNSTHRCIFEIVSCFDAVILNFILYFNIFDISEHNYSCGRLICVARSTSPSILALKLCTTLSRIFSPDFQHFDCHFRFDTWKMKVYIDMHSTALRSLGVSYNDTKNNNCLVIAMGEQQQKPRWG